MTKTVLYILVHKTIYIYYEVNIKFVNTFPDEPTATGSYFTKNHYRYLGGYLILET